MCILPKGFGGFNSSVIRSTTLSMAEFKVSVISKIKAANITKIALLTSQLFAKSETNMQKMQKHKSCLNADSFFVVHFRPAIGMTIFNLFILFLYFLVY